MHCLKKNVSCFARKDEATEAGMIHKVKGSPPLRSRYQTKLHFEMERLGNAFEHRE